MVDADQIESTSQAQTRVVAAVNLCPVQVYQRIFEFNDAHPRCRARKITAQGVGMCAASRMERAA
jgi:hypothetical protein